MFKKAATLILSAAVALGMLISPLPTLAADGDGETGAVWQDGFYTTTVNTDKASYGYQTDADGNITSYGFSYPKNDYDFPVTVQIQDGKIVDVAYTQDVYSIVANTSSDINYLMWAMDGHNVTDASYNYLAAEGKNYDKYHLDPKPVKNGVGIRDQIIEKQSTEGVDTVTAASITSRAIIKSVELSLAKAEKGEKDDPAPVLPVPDTSADVVPKDGVYMGFGDCIGADLSEENPIILYVKDGKMTADLMFEQRQSSYPYLFAGTEKEALEAGEENWLTPIDYDYGYKYPGSLYKGVSIKSLDKKIPFVSLAKSSGNWFNRPITISQDKLTKVPYGDYEADDFTFEGGTGRVTITCGKIRVTRQGIFADVVFDSGKYIKAAVNGVEYQPSAQDAGSTTFTLPLNINGQTVVSGTTTAMSSETTIDYTCTVKFDAEDLKPIEKVYQDGFYTTEVSTNKASYGWKYAKDGVTVQYGFSYPSKDYTFPLTIQIQDGKIVDVAYTQDPNEIMANTSSDFNYLLWALEGHNVTDYSYAYLADEGNYETYHLNPYPAKNGTGMREQIIANNGTNDVDTVTAATITSRAIIDSVDQSLAKAEKGEKDDPAPVLPTPDTSEDIIPADGEYTIEGDCVGADLGAGTVVLTVKDGKMTATMGIEQRQKSYPYIYAGTEAEALAAGEEGWLVPEDYDYGYKYPGSMYHNVPIKSLDKPLHFVMYAAGSGNWFNRLITLDSKTLQETEASKAADLSTAEVKVAAQTYTGNALKPAVTVVKGDKTLTEGTDYTVEYKDNTKVGTATVTVTGKGDYHGTATATFKINKGKTTFTAKAKPAKVTVKKLKKKAQTTKINVTKLSKGSSKVTFKIKSVSKGQKSKVKINKNGKITIKKGTKACKIVVTVTSKANANRKALTKKITITVK